MGGTDVLVAHLPGKHDQSTHGGGAGAAITRDDAEEIVTSLPAGEGVYYHSDRQAPGAFDDKVAALDAGENEIYLTDRPADTLGYLERQPGTVYALQLSPSAKIAREDEIFDTADDVLPGGVLGHFGYRPSPFEIAEQPRVQRGLRQRGFDGAAFRDQAPGNAYEHNSIVVWNPAALTRVDQVEIPALVASQQARPRTVRGLSDETLTAYEVMLESAVVAALEGVAGRVAASLAGPVLVAHLPGKHDQAAHGRGGSPADLHDEATIKSTFNYHDQQTGLRAEVTSIRSGAGGSAYVDIAITDRDGNHVGEAVRTIRPPGQRTVQHDGMALQPGTQGQGFATRFNAHAEESYRAHGITKITTTANIDVGGYSHARAGYDFANHNARAEAIVHMAGTSNRYPSDVRDALNRAIRNPNVSPLELAMIGHTPGATMWPGKQMLLGSTWDGVKKL